MTPNLTVSPKRWHLDAACAHHPDPAIWTSAKLKDQTRAALVCERCPVRVPCGVEGAEQSYGMWAGRWRG